jgi:Protein kinase domain
MSYLEDHSLVSARFTSTPGIEGINPADKLYSRPATSHSDLSSSTVDESQTNLHSLTSKINNMNPYKEDESIPITSPKGIRIMGNMPNKTSDPVAFSTTPFTEDSSTMYTEPNYSTSPIFHSISPEPTPSKKIADTKHKLCRSVDEIDGTENHKSTLRSNTPSTVQYSVDMTAFLQSTASINDRIPFDLTPESFLSNKHFCNGSHSRVFKASTTDSKKVILKVLSESSVLNNVAQKDFWIEIDILSRLHHPHIVNLIGYGSLPSKQGDALSRPLIALEALQGDTLSYHLGLKRSFHDKPFTKLRYIRIAKEFASALNYIHYGVHPEFTLIHRDLKPDNIGTR